MADREIFLSSFSYKPLMPSWGPQPHDLKLILITAHSLISKCHPARHQGFSTWTDRSTGRWGGGGRGDKIQCIAEYCCQQLHHKLPTFSGVMSQKLISHVYKIQLEVGRSSRWPLRSEADGVSAVFDSWFPRSFEDSPSCHQKGGKIGLLHGRFFGANPGNYLH